MGTASWGGRCEEKLQVWSIPEVDSFLQASSFKMSLLQWQVPEQVWPTRTSLRGVLVLQGLVFDSRRATEVASVKLEASTMSGGANP